MAIHINKAILVGRLGADPDVKGHAGGIVTFNVATSESWKDRETGEKVERTQWHKVVVFAEATARFVASYAKKGDLVAVEGQIETRKWEKAPDDTRYFTEIVVRPYGGSVQLLSTEDRQREPVREREEPAPAPRTGRSSRELDDEIPF